MSDQPELKSSVVVAGAGLVGSLLAIFLARRGRDVELHERRADPRIDTLTAGKSINLALSTRGLHALRAVGLEEAVLEQSIPMRGRMIHSRQGVLTFQAYGQNDSECIYSVSRGGLNRTLLAAAQDTGRVRCHFQSRAVGLDPLRRTVRFADDARGGAEHDVHTAALFGTDGAHSVLRAELLGRRAAAGTESLLNYGYKELHIPPGPGGAFRLEANALHIWPRGTYMLIALPNQDGSFTATLFLPLAGAASFATLTDEAAVSSFFAENFADARTLIRDFPRAFFANPTGHMVTVKCAPWNLGDWGLLVGDAAHAIVPFFGQGMNCGFEDCTLLDRLMGSGPEWADGTFAAFSELRKPDADAIADLAVENFIEMRDKVGDPRFLLEKEVEKRLEREMPGEYLSRYRLVTFHRVAYRLALEVSGIQDRLLHELCAGLTTAAELDLPHARALVRERLGSRLATFHPTAPTANP